MNNNMNANNSIKCSVSDCAFDNLSLIHISEPTRP